jgi:glycosyltransferase involved in cell wall biosynthesis
VTGLPRITALMPVRNGMKFLGRSRVTLDASLAPGDELIIINDNSIDGTSKFLEKWQDENSQVRVIENKGSGLISSLQLGVAESQNNWIARYDVDDEYPTNRLKIQRNAISEGVGAIFSDYKFISDSDLNLGVLPSPIENHATSISLVNGNRTPHPSVLFCKDAYSESRGYRDFDYLVEDLSLWLRMSRVSKIISVPEVLLNYRLHSNSVTLSNQSEMRKNKRALLHNIGIYEPDVKYSFENFNKIFDSYRYTGYKSEREAAFLYDFISVAWNDDTGIRNSPRIYQKLSKLLQPNIVRAALELKNDQKLRNSFRGL